MRHGGPALSAGPPWRVVGEASCHAVEALPRGLSDVCHTPKKHANLDGKHLRRRILGQLA
jgi:hypothetical protein